MSKLVFLDRKQAILRFLACYALYVVLLALSVVVFLLWRSTVALVVGAVLDRELSGPFVYAVLMLLIGLALFVVVVLAEHSMRDGIQKQQVKRRFVRFAVPLVVAIILGALTQEIVRLVVLGGIF